MTDLLRILVPDVQDELVQFTAPLDEALRHLAMTNDDVDTDPLPAILAGPGADALSHIRSLIDHAPPLTLYAPDGRYEHEPIRVIDIEPGHLGTIAALLDELRRVVLETGYRGDVDEYLNDFLDAYDRADLDSGGILELLARFHGVLDFDNAAELAVLAAPLERARSGLAPVTLTDDEEAAYRRLRDRWVAMWHDHSVIDRWLY